MRKRPELRALFDVILGVRNEDRCPRHSLLWDHDTVQQHWKLCISSCISFSVTGQIPEIGQLFPEDGLHNYIYTVNKSKETGNQLVNCTNQIGHMERKHKATQQMRETEVAGSLGVGRGHARVTWPLIQVKCVAMETRDTYLQYACGIV